MPGEIFAIEHARHRPWPRTDYTTCSPSHLVSRHVLHARCTLSLTARVAALAIASRMNAHGRDPDCAFMSAVDIAERIGASERTVWAAVRELRAQVPPLFDICRGKNVRGTLRRCNTFTLIRAPFP